ncbi:MAG: FGGY-family carbohydrate kinase [Spirochaetes bacterium]|nr:FGGY-family carbohydrate kinase [Spirochaetota bacterium]
MTDQYVLAIDLGTSGPKVALVDETGNVLACEVEATELHLLPNGGAEQDPNNWWQTICAASKKLLSKNLVPIEQIQAVAVTSQWSGTVAVDDKGNHLHNAIIWMDSRGAKHVAQAMDGLVKFQGYDVVKLAQWILLTAGMPGLSGKDPLAHILFIKNEMPDLYAKTYKFMEPKDYLNLRLTGRFATAQDAIALHWLTDNRDLNKVYYHPSLIKATGIDQKKLPDLYLSTDVLGTLLPQAASDLGLPANLKVVLGTPDVQSAALGSGAVEDFAAHLYIGTSSWLTCHVPFKKTDADHNMATIPSAIPGKYLIGNEHETAGYCLTYLRDKVFYPKDAITPEGAPPDAYQKFNDLAASVAAGSDKLIFTPWLIGERTPVEDHTIRGGFFNMSLSTTRAHMVRAVFEGVAYNSRWLLEAVEGFIDRKLAAINMIGGGARSDLWCQMHADILNREIRQVADPVQANARGVGLLAGVSLGRFRFRDISNRVAIAKTYKPNPAHRKIYDELYAEFKNIYQAHKKIHARLNKAH